MIKMTMTFYSGVTILYICLIVITAYAMILKQKHKNFKIFGISSEVLFYIALLATLIYCFLTATAIEYLKFIWTNFVFIVCVIGAVLFALFICSGFKNILSNKLKLAKIDESIETLQKKIESIDERVLSLFELRNNPTTPSAAKERANKAIDELREIKDKYNETISELMIQKTLVEAEMDSDCVEAIKLTSSKTVKNKLNFNLDKFDSSKELDDSLGDVRSLMKNYK